MIAATTTATTCRVRKLTCQHCLRKPPDPASGRLCSACLARPGVRRKFHPLPPCVHCGQRNACVVSGRLCWRCHQATDLRRQYHPLPPPCRRCGQSLASRSDGRRPDGLCRRCRERETLPEAVRAVLDEIDRLEQVVGPGPVAARPGSVLKQAVLGVRAAAGQPLFHPGDIPATEEG